MQLDKLQILQNDIVKFMLENAGCTLSTKQKLHGLALDRLQLLSTMMLEKYAYNISRLLPITASYLETVGDYHSILARCLKKYPPINLSYFDNTMTFYRFVQNLQLFKMPRYPYLKTFMEYEISIACIRYFADKTGSDSLNRSDFTIVKTFKLLKLEHDINICAEAGRFINPLLPKKAIYLLIRWDFNKDKLNVVELSIRRYQALIQLQKSSMLTGDYTALVHSIFNGTDRRLK